MGFIDLEKAYVRVNRKTLWQLLLLGITSVYVKGGESKCFMINSVVR